MDRNTFAWSAHETVRRKIAFCLATRTQFLTDSSLPRYTRPGISRNPGPASVGMAAFHDRNTHMT
jgi:hypothetical protein